jgi:hypothetical protein
MKTKNMASIVALSMALILVSCGKKEETKAAAAAPVASTEAPADSNVAETPTVTAPTTTTNAGTTKYASKAELLQAIRDNKFAAARPNVEFYFTYGTKSGTSFWGVTLTGEFNVKPDIRKRVLIGGKNFHRNCLAYDALNSANPQCTDQNLIDALVNLVETASRVGYYPGTNAIYVISADGSTIYYLDMSKTLIENPISEQKKHTEGKITYYYSNGWYSSSNSGVNSGDLL